MIFSLLHLQVFRYRRTKGFGLADRLWEWESRACARPRRLCPYQFAASFIKTHHPSVFSWDPYIYSLLSPKTIRKEFHQENSLTILRLTSHQREEVSKALTLSKISHIETRPANTHHLILATSDFQWQRWNIMIWEQRHHVRACMSVVGTPVEVRELHFSPFLSLALPFFCPSN